MINVVRQWFNESTGSATVSVAVSGVYPGDTLIVIPALFNSTGATTFNAPTDDAPGGSSSYASLGTAMVWTATFRSILHGYYANITKAGITTVTATNSRADSNNNLLVLKLTNADSSPVDQFNTAQVTSQNPANPSITTTNPTDLLICAMTHDGATTTLTSPFVNSTQEDETGTVNAFSGGYRVVRETGIYAGAWATGASRDNSIIQVALKSDTVARLDPLPKNQLRPAIFKPGLAR